MYYVFADGNVGAQVLLCAVVSVNSRAYPDGNYSTEIIVSCMRLTFMNIAEVLPSMTFV